MKLFRDWQTHPLISIVLQSFSHIAAVANFTRALKAGVSLDPDRMDSTKKWQTQVTHLSVDVFCVVEELLEE